MVTLFQKMTANVNDVNVNYVKYITTSKNNL